MKIVIGGNRRHNAAKNGANLELAHDLSGAFFHFSIYTYAYRIEEWSIGSNVR